MNLDRSLIHRILVIKLRAIGDVLLSTAILSNLRSAYPNTQIDFLTERPSREVVEGNPSINSVIVFDGKKQGGLSLIMDIRRRKYDLVIDLFGNPRSAIVTLLSGARHRVGYRFKWRQHCYNIVVEPRGGDVHNVQFNLDALEAIGIPVQTAAPVFPVDAEARKFAEHFFRQEGLDGKFVVAINGSGGWIAKRWRLPQFAQLADRIVEAYDAKILLLWGPGEQKDAEVIQQQMKHPATLLPSTTLKQLAAILARCSAMVTNDSGPMHIAAVTGTPVVAIFGPTNPYLQGPVGMPHEIVRNERLLCLGCNFTECPIGNPCMEELQVEEVLVVFERLVEKCEMVNSSPTPPSPFS